MYEGAYYNCQCGHVNREIDRDCVKCGLAEAPAPQPVSPSNSSDLLNDREIELIKGMIEVQESHAARCDTIANRTMAEKQKNWDLERVALLKKILTRGI